MRNLSMKLHYQTKKPDELVDEILKLKNQLKNMSNNKFEMLYTYKNEINMLNNKLTKIKFKYNINDDELDKIEIQDLQTSINEYNGDNNKRKRASIDIGNVSFLGGNKNYDNNIEPNTHQYTKSKIEFSTYNIPSLTAKLHSRAQSVNAYKSKKRHEIEYQLPKMKRC